MLPGYLREFSMITSAAEAFKMSMDEVEEKFTLTQLFIMSTIQSIQFEHDKKERHGGRGSGRVLNRAANPQEQNKKAWKYL